MLPFNFYTQKYQEIDNHPSSYGIRIKQGKLI
ncbi:hypothetical protein MiTa_00251 [Microcystis aeruginosa NIES-4264]|nr:hypothetical protein MiHa_00115 [Microcystis aeruginosa NIES-2522]GCA86927.1 hypothetical protein MiTa_00251 [Microcystis aeruginosa NIES-4264]